CALPICLPPRLPADVLAVWPPNGAIRGPFQAARTGNRVPMAERARVGGRGMAGKALVCAMTALALTACATTKYTITPVDTGAAQLSYYNGRPTADLELRNGAVRVTPLGVEVNGRISFAVAGYNKLDMPSDFGPGNFTARVGGAWVPVYSYEDLEREAGPAATGGAGAVAWGRLQHAGHAFGLRARELHRAGGRGLGAGLFVRGPGAGGGVGDDLGGGRRGPGRGGHGGGGHQQRLYQRGHHGLHAARSAPGTH